MWIAVPRRGSSMAWAMSCEAEVCKPRTHVHNLHPCAEKQVDPAHPTQSCGSSFPILGVSPKSDELVQGVHHSPRTRVVSSWPPAPHAAPGPASSAWCAREAAAPHESPSPIDPSGPPGISVARDILVSVESSLLRKTRIDPYDRPKKLLIMRYYVKDNYEALKINSTRLYLL